MRLGPSSAPFIVTLCKQFYHLSSHLSSRRHCRFTGDRCYNSRVSAANICCCKVHVGSSKSVFATEHVHVAETTCFCSRKHGRQVCSDKGAPSPPSSSSSPGVCSCNRATWGYKRRFSSCTFSLIFAVANREDRSVDAKLTLVLACRSRVVSAKCELATENMCLKLQTCMLLLQNICSFKRRIVAVITTEAILQEINEFRFTI